MNTLEEKIPESSFLEGKLRSSLFLCVCNLMNSERGRKEMGMKKEKNKRGLLDHVVVGFKARTRPG